MALDRNTQLAIKAKLRTGMKPKDVAEQLNVKLPTVYKMAQEIKNSKLDEDIQSVHQIPDEVLHTIVETAKETADAPTTDVLDAVESGAKGLKKLDGAFQSTIMGALARFDELLKDAELPLKDIKMIIDTSATAYEKVFSSGTNIHIGDNNQNNNQLSVFKTKMGV